MINSNLTSIQSLWQEQYDCLLRARPSHTHIHTHARTLTGHCIRGQSNRQWGSLLYLTACVSLFTATAEITHTALHFLLETMCLFMCLSLCICMFCVCASVGADFFPTWICPVWVSSVSSCVCVCLSFCLCPVSVSPDSVFLFVCLDWCFLTQIHTHTLSLHVGKRHFSAVTLV